MWKFHIGGYQVCEKWRKDHAFHVGAASPPLFGPASPPLFGPASPPLFGPAPAAEHTEAAKPAAKRKKKKNSGGDAATTETDELSFT